MSEENRRARITASCGHGIEDVDDSVSVLYKDTRCDMDGYHKAVISAEYCPNCAKELSGDPAFLSSWEEAEKWLDEEEK
jgi:hypothetical protein